MSKIDLKKDLNPDYFCNLDSDSVSNPSWLIKLVELADRFKEDKAYQTPIIFTAYNSCLHNIIEKQEDFAFKQSIGGMNIFFESYSLPLVLKSFKNKNGRDWALISLVKKNQGHFISTIPSYLQHIGLNGLHCQNGIVKGSKIQRDIALDFKSD